MKTYAFYDPKTGLLLDARVMLADSQLEANTPPGFVALEGHFDHLQQRVDVATGEVVDYQPPAPLDDEDRTWSWDTEQRRWLASPTLASLKRGQSAQIRGAMAMLEVDQARPLRECAIAYANGTVPDRAALEQLEAIDAQMREHRDRLEAVAAAATAEEVVLAAAIDQDSATQLKPE